MDWSKTVLIFPGQGSQHVGMGKDFYETFSVAKNVFKSADDILGLSITKLCLEGPEQDLNDTVNTQPAVYLCAMAILTVLRTEFPGVQPLFIAGHSLGEFTALSAADALSFEDGLKLVRERGRLMKEAGKSHPGGMAALLGIDLEEATQICEEASEQTGHPVVIANDNSPGQIVISGDERALNIALKLAKEAGTKRIIPLAVSIAAHSPMMATAARYFTRSLERTRFQEPTLTIYSNASAQPMLDVDDIRTTLSQQLTHTVRWTETIGEMIANGAETFIEVGPGDVLTKLMKRIDRSKTAIALNDVDALQKLQPL